MKNLQNFGRNNGSQESEHLFIFNHESYNFETALIPADNKNVVFSMEWTSYLLNYPNCKLYKCIISTEEAEELNQQMKGEPHYVVKQLLGRTSPAEGS
jgi:hypothetical protein